LGRFGCVARNVLWHFSVGAARFAVAGFLFNGGIAGFQFFQTFKFLTIRVATRSLGKAFLGNVRYPTWMLYAIRQVGFALALAEKFFSEGSVAGADLSAVASAKADDPSQSAAVHARAYTRGPLPFWVELSLYASMPFFHVHTFLALTIVLIVALLFERPVN